MNGSTRRAFLRDLAGLGASMAGLALFAGCTPARPGSSPARVYQVGLVAIPGGGAVVRPFWARLEELGYVEGQNLVKIDRSGGEDTQTDRNPLAIELVRLPVDVIVAGSGPAIRAAMAATTSIPIVLAGTTGDPVALGFVASMARPGGNVTGVAGTVSDLEGKRL